MIEVAKATREGDDYVYTWEEAQVCLVLRAVRESHGEPYAEVTAYWLREDGERKHLCGPTRHSIVGTAEPRGRRQAGLRALSRRRHPGGLGAPGRAGVRPHRGGDARGRARRAAGGEAPPPPPREWLFKPLLGWREPTMVYADGDSGKSYFALAVAAHYALGRDLAGGLAKLEQPPGVTLYCDWETNQQAVGRRWRRIGEGLGVQPPPTLVYLPMERPLTQDADRLRRWVQESGAGLVVIDSIGFAAAEHELTSAEAAIKMFAIVSRLNVTVLLLHHMNKAVAGQRQGNGEAYGTVYFRNSARGSWEMRSDQVGQDDKLLALYDQKGGEGRKRLAPLSLRMHFEGEEGPVTVARADVRESPDLNARRPLGERLIDALRPGARALRDCLEELELGEDKLPSLQVTANRLLNKGRLVRVDGELWGLPADEPRVVQWRPREEGPTVEQGGEGEPPDPYGHVPF
jgi:hypothetical protein